VRSYAKQAPPLARTLNVQRVVQVRQQERKSCAKPVQHQATMD
jgi:hypothetical protein